MTWRLLPPAGEIQMFTIRANAFVKMFQGTKGISQVCANEFLQLMAYSKRT